MISGSFGDGEELIFEIELIAGDGFKLPIDVILDAGFSDWLAIERQDLEGFDWEYLGERSMLMASGVSNFDIYAGKVRIDGKIFDIPVYAGGGVPEVLLGRQWLTNRKLVEELLKLRRRGIEIDKSELVDLLMAAWVKRQQGENIDLLLDEITPRRKSRIDGK